MQAITYLLWIIFSPHYFPNSLSSLFMPLPVLKKKKKKKLAEFEDS